MTQDITTQETETRTLLDRSKKASSNSTEVKVLTRGGYYLTPFTLDHIPEVVAGLSYESRRELELLGHIDIAQALHEMFECSDCYIVRKQDEDFMMVCGLWYSGDVGDQDFPQLFAMFSDKIKDSFYTMARGSKMLISFFDKTESHMVMSILAEHQIMLDWASWLGFEAVGVSNLNSASYVDFVRCNPSQKNVYDGVLRPITH